MKQIVIIGAGGFGREVQWLIERINEQNMTWKIKGYIDDGVEIGTQINGYTVLGGVQTLLNRKEKISVVCAIGSAKTRKRIIDKLSSDDNLEFPNLIDPNVQMSRYVNLGKGNIICAGNILTTNITVKDFAILNLGCTIGHDAVINSFVTVYPSVNISGCVTIGENVEVGTGTQIIQGKNICANAIVGAGSVVVKDIENEGTYVGVPAKPIKYKGGEKE